MMQSARLAANPRSSRAASSYADLSIGVFLVLHFILHA
jgi:hypothetical protein